jgi:hypothetical protein
MAAQEGIRVLAPIFERIASQPPRAGAQPPQPPPPAQRPGPAPAAQPAAAQPQPQRLPAPPPPPAFGGPLSVERLDGTGSAAFQAAPTSADFQPENRAPVPTSEPVPAGVASTDLFSEDSPEFRQWVSKRIVAMVRKGDEGAYIVDWLLEAGAKKFLSALVNSKPSDVTAYLLLDPILKFAVEDPSWDDTLKEAREYILQQEEQHAPDQQPV